MNGFRRLVLYGSLLAVVLVAGCPDPTKPDATVADVELNGSNYQVRGPLTHQNLTVFLIGSDRQDERDFLTLDEGLQKELVQITEQEEASVGTLQIENKSDRPLYLQEGERLQGGKQDRTIISSLVIPTGSGKTKVPTFCVEQSRWTEGDKGKAFGFTVTSALAPKGVRGAAKIEGSQEGVWTCVADQKKSAQTTLKTRNTNSSVNEMLDDPKVRSISEEYVKALTADLDGSLGRDAVGVAIVFNGQIEEIDIYPNRALFVKLYPRLIQSYALQAALLKDQAQATQPMSAVAVAEFLKGGGEKSKKENALDPHNRVLVREMEDDKFQCTTHYDDRVIHWQMLKKNGKADDARSRILGARW